MKSPELLDKIKILILSSKTRSLILALLIPIWFLVFGTITIDDYGINWDEPIHFMRGQAYLHFLLTGESDYSSLPPYPQITPECASWVKPGNCGLSPEGASDIQKYGGKPVIYEDAIENLYLKDANRRSYFQSDIYTPNTFLEYDEGHPPLSDIFAAGFNYVLFQKLKIMGDLASYHFYEIFISSLLILGVFLFVRSELGIIPAFISAISLSIYPIFFSESHFNIKDTIEASFFGLTLISFYFGITKNNWKILLASAVFAGLAFGTKFNIVFASFILFPWLIYYFATQVYSRFGVKKALKKVKNIKAPVVVLAFYLPVVFGIFYLFWPHLWPSPVSNFLKIAGYYRQIGIGTPSEMSAYLKNGWNTYPIIWIIYTTQVPILLLSAIGFVVSFRKIIKKNSFAALTLLWFTIPVLRVSWPGAGIYGGIRQIMEFVPALAILVGIGAHWLVQVAQELSPKKRRLHGGIAIALIVLGLAFSLYEMVKIHPNQNVYFNQLIGGLSGAREKNIPYWGNTYGNVYLQGIRWLNENAEPNSKLGLAIATMGNVPRLKLRTDINFLNANWSGTRRDGEYEMEMDFEWPPKAWYAFQYLDQFLEPVYIVQVDGVPLLKIWKNDLEHTKPMFREETKYQYFSKTINDEAFYPQLRIDLGKEIFLTKLIINHSITNCQKRTGGYLATSVGGDNWQREPEPITVAQVPPDLELFDEDTFIFRFAAKKARYILLDTQIDKSCLLKFPKIEIKGLKKLP